MEKYYSIVKEEVSRYGLDNARVKELLALIIGTKADSEFCQKVGLLPPSRILALSKKELLEQGATPSMAEKLEACFKLAGKLQSIESNGDTINSPADAAKALAGIANEEQENFVVLLLNTKNKIIKLVPVTKGTLNSSLAHPREVFKTAIRENANGVIIGHNHPSGNPNPSNQDVEITKRFIEAGKIIGIEVVDHIIMSSTGYLSLKEMGLI